MLDPKPGGGLFSYPRGTRFFKYVAPPILSHFIYTSWAGLGRHDSLTGVGNNLRRGHALLLIQASNPFTHNILLRCTLHIVSCRSEVLSYRSTKKRNKDTNTGVNGLNGTSVTGCPKRWESGGTVRLSRCLDRWAPPHFVFQFLSRYRVASMKKRNSFEWQCWAPRRLILTQPRHLTP